MSSFRRHDAHGLAGTSIADGRHFSGSSIRLHFLRCPIGVGDARPVANLPDVLYYEWHAAVDENSPDIFSKELAEDTCIWRVYDCGSRRTPDRIGHAALAELNEIPQETSEIHVSSGHKHSPDLVGEELGDEARIWHVYDSAARDDDHERIGHWNRGLDNLALFAGLFSAVTTAFIIELRQDTEPDYLRLTFLLLNASAAGAPFTGKAVPFAIEPVVRVTNCLWVASLMLSLTAALIAIMGKDWIGMYASRPVCNPRQWAEIRTYRLACVERWCMSGVIASAPVLLHLSLGLFAAGLVAFLSSDIVAQRVALALSIAAGGLYLITGFSAIIFTSSPFRSPATQAIRIALSALTTSLLDTLSDPPRRRPIEMLQETAFIIGSALSLPTTSDLPPLDPFRRGYRAVFWDRPFSGNSLTSGPSRGLMARSRAQLTTISRWVSRNWRAAIDEYTFRRQRPRARALHSSVWRSLRQLDLSDPWAAVRRHPTPENLAHSLSRLDAMSQSSEVLQSILFALGDVNVGRTVAPLVSPSLTSRLTADIRHNWQNADLAALSDYILADRHISSHAPVIPSSVIDRFGGDDGYHSERIVFAIAELPSTTGVVPDRILHHCPDIMLQPRVLQHLLPVLEGEGSIDLIIILAERYSRHLDGNWPLALEGELLRRLHPRYQDRYIEQVTSHFGGQTGLVEFLSFHTLAEIRSNELVTAFCSLILLSLKAECQTGPRQHVCLVHVFGCRDRWAAKAVWAAPVHLLGYLESGLPMLQKRPYMEEHDPPFEIALARTIVRLMSPELRYCNLNYRHNPTARGAGPPSLPPNREQCIQRLRTQLCGSRAALCEAGRDEIMLESGTLVQLCWDESDIAQPRTGRPTINILSTIARRIAELMTSAETDSLDTGARLLALFASTRAEGPGWSETWELGDYLCQSRAKLADMDPSAQVSMRRLLRAVRALRPLCMKRDDVRAAWQLIRLPPDEGFTDAFWDAEHFGLEEFPVPQDGDLSAVDESPPAASDVI